MNLYEKYLLPKLIHRVCGLSPMMRQRQKIVPLARGRVLEIGIGSGLNLDYYLTDKVTEIIGVDPTPELNKLQQAVDNIAIPVTIIQQGIDDVHIPVASIDTVVTTYTLCTVPDPQRALEAAAKYLKDDGQLLFIEHGHSDDVRVNRTQDICNPLWKRIAGGCHLNRDISAIIDAAGYDIQMIDSMYLPGWRPATYNVWGVAKKKKATTDNP